jgi:general secretion pathway protein J
VAIALLALVSVLSWRGISSLLATRERLGPQAQALRQDLVALGQLERDLAHVPVGAALNALRGPALRIDGSGGQAMLELLRRVPDPAGGGAQGLARVRYRILEGRLVREASPAQAVFPTGEEALERNELVEDVSAIEIRLWRNGTGWVAALPGPEMAATPGLEFTIVRRDGSRLRRVCALG